jgi:hypothetical protein
VKPLVALRHAEGELLRARDLEAAVAGEAARRALHVRAVHGTWGVALGFALEPEDGGRAVAVGPGFGYDCRGREIASAERLLVPLSSRQDSADLVVWDRCGIRLGWREPGRACEDELLLARGRFEAGRAVALDESVRRWCRSRRFRLAAGIVEKQFAAKLNVSTAAGGFRTAPHYFATLATEARVGVTLEIDNETATSFRLSLRGPTGQIAAANRDKLTARVHWVGVERLPRCGIDPEEDR